MSLLNLNCCGVEYPDVFALLAHLKKYKKHFDTKEEKEEYEKNMRLGGNSK